MLAVVGAGVLWGVDGEIASDMGGDALAFDHRPIERGVTTAGECGGAVATADDGFAVAGVGAVGFAFGSVDREVETKAAGAKADADTAATGFVTAVHAGAVDACLGMDVAFGIEVGTALSDHGGVRQVDVGVFTRAAGDEVDRAIGGDATADAGGLLTVGFGFGLLYTQTDADRGSERTCDIGR